jgi:tRNA (guanine26-N2/guanine27-N2)-dimethyltransferase
MYSEGKAKIRESDKAFLNPVGKASRDLSVAYVKLLANKKSTLLDATAATGIRAIRYAKESGIKNPTILEINDIAYKAMKPNLTLNKIKADARNESVQEFANTTNQRFDFMDLDPFGGITPYIFDLMKITNDGARLMVTATDVAVLCGADSKACMRLYDAKPIHNELCHESGMRVMIGYVARVAGQFGFGINVELSISYMHYMRSFIRLTHGAASAYSSLEKMGYLKYCDKCCNREVEMAFLPKASDCRNCKTKMAAYGRMWMGELKDQKIVDKLDAALKVDDEKKEAAKLVSVIKDELQTPFYYHIPTLTKKMGVGSASHYSVAEALEKKGFKVSQTHMKNSAIKSDAGLIEVMAAITSVRKSKD